MLQEFTSSRGVDMRIDRDAAVIRGVKLLGLASRNGRTYLPAALVQAAALYEGAKVNVNHPKGSPLAARDYQDRLGAIRDVRVRGEEGLFGDLHFNPKHALAEQLLWDAQHAPENVGLSHNVEARTSRRDGRTVVEAILKVQSVDLVADPATTRGLYEGAHSAAGAASASGAGRSAGNATDDSAAAPSTLTLETLRAERPDLVEAIILDSTLRIAALESELDRLRARDAAHERRAAATRLLKEFHLPDPEGGDAAAARIVSERFFESLLAAPSEQAMRALVEERAGIVAAARRLAEGMGDRGRPTSREQRRYEQPAPRDAREFARAIT
jgi:hypothetical protein